MSAKPRSQTRFTYSFKLPAKDMSSFDTDVSRDDIQQFVNASLGMLTAGCGICEFAHRNNSPALFCEKMNSPVNWGRPRCEYFIRSATQNLTLSV